MPLISDELLGTNKDGSPNPEYCYYCYQHGAYTCDCTMDEMIKVCVKHMMEQDMGDGRKPMTIEDGLECVYRAFFPTLKRWRK